MRILVAGGTGVVGSGIVAEAAARGHDVRVIAGRVPAFDDPRRVAGVRYDAVDLYRSSPDDLDPLFSGVDVVVDALNGESRVAQAIFTVGAAQIADAAATAGVGRILVVSVAGCDESAHAYHEAKAEQEGVYLDSPTPTTVVRVTQFSEYVAELIEKVSGWGFIPSVSKASIQPIAVADAARAIVAVLDGPAPEEDDIVGIGGPEILESRAIADIWKQETGSRRPIVPLPPIGALGTYLRLGLNLLPEERVEGTPFREWLRSRTAAGGAGVRPAAAGGRERRHPGQRPASPDTTSMTASP